VIEMRLSEAASAIGASRDGADVRFTGCGTDSRTLVPGRLFVALRGPNFDGHRFVDRARERGAVAALVDAPGERPLPALVTGDSRVAMGALARAWRRRHALPVVAVT